MQEASLAELLQKVELLSKRVETLETELGKVKAVQAADIPEDVLIAIGAAVSAFLGNKAKVKQVHFRTGAAWAQQGRVAVQGHRILHGVR